MMRFFKGSGHRNEWQCCLCCHVRTGTIMLGLWHLALHILAVSVVAVLIVHPTEHGTNEDVGVVFVRDPVLPTPLSEIDRPVLNGMDSEFETESLTDLNVSLPDFRCSFSGDWVGTGRSVGRGYVGMGVLVTFCSFIITLMMVYGAVRGKPAFLMPFFCLQVFDFCISSMSAAGYICYLPFVHEYVAQNSHMPLRGQLLKLNPQLLSLLVLLVFLGALMIKAYLIGMVWRCYKYLTLRATAAIRTIHFIDPDVENLLSDFETLTKDGACVKKELFPAPPPPYNSVVEDLPPTFDEAVGTSRIEAAFRPEVVPKAVGTNSQ